MNPDETTFTSNTDECLRPTGAGAHLFFSGDSAPSLKLRYKETGISRVLRGKAVYLLGRGRDADVLFEEQFVSRKHCTLSWQGRQWWLEDLESRNGTRLNGERLRPHERHPLSVKDEITLANDAKTTLVVEAVETSASSIPLVEVQEPDGPEPFGRNITLSYEDAFTVDGDHCSSFLEYLHDKRVVRDVAYRGAVKTSERFLPIPSSVRTEEALRRYVGVPSPGSPGFLVSARALRWTPAPEGAFDWLDVTALGTLDPCFRQYLEKIGQQQNLFMPYLVRIRLSDGKQLLVRMLGWQNSNIVMRGLSDKGYLSGMTRFCNWPSVSDLYGPAHHHVGASACELENIVYYMEWYTRDDIVCMYGCPRAGGLRREEPEKTVTVTAY